MQAGIKVQSPSSISLRANDNQLFCLALTRPRMEMVIRPADGKSNAMIFRKKGNYPDAVIEKLEVSLHKKISDVLTVTGFSLNPLSVEVFLPPHISSLDALLACCSCGLVTGLNHMAPAPLRFEPQQLLPLTGTSAFGSSVVVHPGHSAATLLGGLRLLNDPASGHVYRIYSPSGLTYVLYCIEGTFTDQPLLPISKTGDRIHGKHLSMEAAILGFMQSDLDLIRTAFAWRQAGGYKHRVSTLFPDAVADHVSAISLGWEVLDHQHMFFAIFQNQRDAEHFGSLISQHIKPVDKDNFLITTVDLHGTVVL